MSLAELTWLAVACYALHILEEHELNWRDWAREVIGLPVEWPDFYVTNALVIAFGICAANLAAWPLFALSYAAVMLINATFFHVLPFILSRGRFSPGLITAVLLFYPVGSICYGRAIADGASWRAVFGSLMLGVLLMATPVALLRIKDWPYFQQAKRP